MESPAVQLEIVNLLKEIKELLNARNDPSPSAMENTAEAKSRRRGQLDGSSFSQSPSSPNKNDNDEDVEESQFRGPMVKTRYYECDPPQEWIGKAKKTSTNRPLCPVEKAMKTTLTAGPNWEYWKPIQQEKQDESNEIKEWRSPGNGLPNYMPEWEIVRVAGERYHVDGTKLGPEIDFSLDAEFEEEERPIPYSLSSNTWPVPCNELSGLNDRHKFLDECLGQLRCVPAHTIMFRFEKAFLRAAANKNLLSTSLKKTRDFFELLNNHGGAFEVVDIDDRKSWVVYDHRSEEDRSDGYCWDHEKLSDSDPRVMMTGVALFAEQFTLQVPPVYCTLTKRVGEPPVIVHRGATRWYRIINIRGIAAIKDDEHDKPTGFQRSNYFDAIYYLIFGPDLLRTFIEAYHLHVDCRSRSEATNPFVSDWAPFHISWFRIGPDNNRLPEFSKWKSGRLYGTTSGDDRRMEEVAFTMCFYPFYKSRVGVSNNLETNVDCLKDPYFWYWSILVLTPPHFNTFRESSRDRRKDQSIMDRSAIRFGGHLAPLGLIFEALRDAANSWEAIADHLAGLANQRDAIFAPDLHDRLLFDDDAFSRSRLYFWAIDSLEQFIPVIAANIREWEIFWKPRKIFFSWASVDGLKRGDPSMRDKTSYEDVVQQIEEEVMRLRAFKARLVVLREQIKTLRDGLFNASAVIESRAATELGQNIRLLTYVSIVYLPLSFCAAAWNIDYSYHTATFVVVTVLLSTTTYLAVMNLNNVSRLSKGLYQRYRNDVVKSMMEDKEWASMGEKFSRFRPQRESDAPSEWHVVVFAVSQLWKRVICYLLELQKKILKLMLKKPTQDIENNAAGGGTPA